MKGIILPLFPFIYFWEKNNLIWSQITPKWFWNWNSNHFQIFSVFLIQIYFKFAPGLECHVAPLFIFEMGQRNLKLFKWEGFQMEFQKWFNSPLSFIKLWRSHFISSLESPWVASSLHYFQMRFQNISNGNTFGEVLSFPLIQLSKSFKLHSTSLNHSHKNQKTIKTIYLI